MMFVMGANKAMRNVIAGGLTASVLVAGAGLSLCTVQAYASEQSNGEISVVNAQSISPAENKLVLKKGSRYNLKATTSNKASICYKSSNKKVISVSKKGLLKAGKKGTATVTVSAKGAATRKVKVQVVSAASYKKPTKVKMRLAETSLTVGSSFNLIEDEGFAKVNISPAKVSNRNLVFSSSDKKVLRVEPNGEIKALKAGKAKLVAKCADKPNVKTSVAVNVLAESPASDFAYMTDDAGAHITAYTYGHRRYGDASFWRNIIVPGKIEGKDVVSVAFRAGDDEWASFSVDLSNADKLESADLNLDGANVSADNNPFLKSVRIDANDGIGPVDLGGAPNLESLSISGNTILEQMYFANKAGLKSLTCNYTQNALYGAVLDLSDFTGLKTLDCRYCGLAGIDISGCPNLESVDCSHNRITGTAALEEWGKEPGHTLTILPQGV